MAVVMMSRKELGRLEALVDLDAGRITAAQAASADRPRRAAGVPAAEGVPGEGAEGLASRRRGRPSNRRHPDAVREAALAAVRERYADFGPTLAAEKLAEVHDLRLGRETLRRWMAAAGPLGPAQGARPARPPAPPPPGLPGRAGAGRRLRAPLVRGPRPALHPARLRRRRHQPADAPAVRAQREHARLPPGGQELRRGARQAGRLLLRQAHRLPGDRDAAATTA